MSIRIDLEQKIEHVALELRALQGRTEHLERVQQALRLLMEEESAQLTMLPSGGGANGRHRPPTLGRTEKSAFLMNALAERDGRLLKTLTKLARAEKIDFKGKDPSRSLHFALIGLQRNDYTVRAKNGRWSLTAKARTTLDTARSLGAGTESTTSTVAGQ